MLEQCFQKIFKATPEQTAYAPGRVNLIGEHIDYNGGMVLPMGLPVGLSIALKRRDDEIIRIASDRFNDIDTRELGGAKTGDWADYAAGAVALAVDQGFLNGGVDLYIDSTIPDGAGLSSSAALIVAILKGARDISVSDTPNEEIAVLARRVENEFIGVPCGIMDQMAVAVAEQGQAIALDTKNLTYSALDIPTGYGMVVIHSGIHRKLADGRYAARRHECDEAANILGNPEICLLTQSERKKAADLREPLNRRVRHCLSEHVRVLNAVEALRTGDARSFGAAMNESHASMRDDFEISLPEIDALVESARLFGAVGARLTGGGFGGCIVACVEDVQYPHWKAQLLSAHSDAFFVC